MFTRGSSQKRRMNSRQMIANTLDASIKKSITNLAIVTNNTYLLFVLTTLSKHTEIQHAPNTVVILHYDIGIVKNIGHL